MKLDALSKRGAAIRLEDCECIGLKIREKVNGESIAMDLEEIFMRAGTPKGIVKDCDATLRKGVRLWPGRQRRWLARHMDIRRQMTALPLLASSDIIESLFGNFKHIIERSPQAGMNRTALLIPALCGSLDKTTITQALSRASHHDLQMWERENIPYTVRRKR